jgi:hypothetical protein
LKSATAKDEMRDYTQLRQRADYTHKHNTGLGRHGWLRLTPAYSRKIVEETLAAIPVSARILDPFCGTATTALCAAYRGHYAATVEINPFLVWFGQAKLAHYSEDDLTCARGAAGRALARIRGGRARPAPPPIHNIGRWWDSTALEFLCSLQSALQFEAPPAPSMTLLEVAFCRTLIKLSNAAFNHQSMSFKREASGSPSFRESSFHDAAELFLEDIGFVLDSAADNPAGEGRVLHGDARSISSTAPGGFDAVITSPPYPNRMSYIRELRPYMYWLGFLKDSRTAAEIDWASIGGTWGAATSRLNDWRASADAFRPRYLAEILGRISSRENANGRLLSHYVAKYFEDMFRHLRSLTAVLAPGARVHYIVGNSTFYGVLLPVERIYADMFSGLGFCDVEIKPIRKRNSKKELMEFDVSARWKH